MAQIVHNTSDIAKKKEVDPDRAAEAQDWIETVIGKKIGGNFFDELKDGCVLCETMNLIFPDSCKKFKPTQVPFVARSNIQIYIQAAKKNGLPEVDCFETRDLFDGQALHRVVDNIYALSALSRKSTTFNGPYIGLKYADENKRNFTEEQLIESRKKGTVPMWNKGDKHITTSNQDAYGIVKTDKDMQKHTGALSQWEKGSNPSNQGVTHDSYGIVKNKDQTQHSAGAGGVWDQGAKPNSGGTGMDSYGIVKTGN